VGPCTYVRRETIELVGALDETLALDHALEEDFAQRCLLAGLSHLAGDDVLVAPLGSMAGAQLETSTLAPEPESSILVRALQALRAPAEKLWVTFDARALDGAIMGTQVHILELIRALADTDTLRLRLLVRGEAIDHATLGLLEALKDTEILFSEELDPTTKASAVFHRPQQTFSAVDLDFATALGERLVLSQLDLIAYRNPGYFPDAATWEDFRRANRHGLTTAERVLVFSDHTRRELLADALVDEQRIRVVPPGLDHRVGGEAKSPAALGVDPASWPADGFLLCLGTDFVHKNRVFALRLLEQLRERHAWEGMLVMAGTHVLLGSSAELERALLEERPSLREALVELGPVDEQEKAWLLEHAGAVVYPSAYEGFGLVPFESALSGTPCVFAPQSSLAETAPDGAATIVPWDPVESAAAVHELLTDETLRQRHLQSLVETAQKLTWAAAAAATVEVYREAALAPVRGAATTGRDAARREHELLAEQARVVQMLIDERELVRHELEALGPGRGLVGSEGSLPEEVQRALLALGNRPTSSRRIYGTLSRLFLLGRALHRLRRR
jgi:glycosyltransferase involved in cell wall biosynthesis